MAHAARIGRGCLHGADLAAGRRGSRGSTCVRIDAGEAGRSSGRADWPACGKNDGCVAGQR